MPITLKFSTCACILLLIGSLPCQAGSQPSMPQVDQCMRYSGICGDADGDRLVNISDAVYLINYIFAGGEAPLEKWWGDPDMDEIVSISDVVYLVKYVFSMGGPPCQSGFAVRDETIPIPFRDCLHYEYDGTSTIQFRHENASFNCCAANKYFDMSVVADTIFIVESEDYFQPGGCNCYCLFDMQFSYSGLAPGNYVIRVTELRVYPEEGDPVLAFQADLTAATTNKFCLYREHYPWGAH